MSTFQSDMNNEFKRYATFSGFRSPDGVWPIQLARSGFYRSGDCQEYEVVCFACGLKVDLRTINRDPITEVHRRLSPNCSFVSGSSNNQPVPPIDPVAALDWLGQNFSLDSFFAREADIAEQGTRSLPNLPLTGGSESVSNGSSLPDNFVMNNIASQLPNLSVLNTLEMTEFGGGSLSSLPMDFLDGFANASLDSVPTSQLFDPSAFQQQQFGSRLGGPGEILVTDGVSIGEEGLYPANTGMPEDQVSRITKQQPQQQHQNQQHQEQQRHQHQEEQQQQPPHQAHNEESPEVKAAADVPEKNVTLGDLGIIVERPKRPELSTVQSRLATFHHWNGPAINQSIQDIAEAGFYYAGYSDCCRCFYCGGGLKSWDYGDVPWVEHARWFKTCPFVRTNKGQEFVQAVENLAQTCSNNGIRLSDVESEIKHIKSTHQLRSTDEEIVGMETEMVILGVGDNEGEDFEHVATEAERLTEENVSLCQPDLCKICYESEVSVLYLPCGHLVTCGTCAPTVSLCPMCRTVVGGQVRIQRDFGKD